MLFTNKGSIDFEIIIFKVDINFRSLMYMISYLFGVLISYMLIIVHNSTYEDCKI